MKTILRVTLMLLAGTVWAETDTGRCWDLPGLTVFAEHWMECDCHLPDWCGTMDLNIDGQVDMLDFSALSMFWHDHCDPPAPEDMVLIPGGTFQMGDSLDGLSPALPVHSVTLSPFYMGQYEVTHQQYCDFLNSVYPSQITVTSGVVYKAGSGTSYRYCDTSTVSIYSQIAFSDNTFRVCTKSGRSMANDPMVRVSWYGAAAYCNWRSQRDGKPQCYDLTTWACDFSKKGYRLPTEAQWEYSGRGGLIGRRFPWGDTINHDHANYSANSSVYPYDTSPYSGATYHPAWNDGTMLYTSPVGSFAPNGYGLYDMTGNVSDWCNDWYGSYSSDSQTNPTGPATGTSRVLRGGSWGDCADYCCVAYRIYSTPAFRCNYSGFRFSLDY